MSNSTDLLARVAQRKALLAEQARQALQDASNNARGTPRPGTPLHPSSPPTGPDPVFESPFAATPSSLVIRGPQAISQSHLQATGERVLKRIKLGDEDQTKLREFCQITDIFEQNTMIMAHLLKVQSLMAAAVSEKSAHWEPSKSLGKTVKSYVKVLLLLPNIKFYAGTLEATVLAALRLSKAKGIPDDNTDESDKLTAFIAREVSLVRSAIKKTIKDATNSKELTSRNIAAVAVAVIGNSKIEATLAMYMQIAYIRTHIRCFEHSATEFWDKIDDGLEDLRKEGPDSFLMALTMNFEDDVLLYGDPSDSELTVGKPVGTHSPQWIQHLSSLAPQVQRSRTKKSAKRRITELGEDDEDEEDSGFSGLEGNPTLEDLSPGGIESSS